MCDCFFVPCLTTQPLENCLILEPSGGVVAHPTLGYIYIYVYIRSTRYLIRGCMQHSPVISSVAQGKPMNTTPYQVHVDQCACTICREGYLRGILLYRVFMDIIVYRIAVSAQTLRAVYVQTKSTGKGLPGPLSDWPTLNPTRSWLLTERVDVCLSSSTQTGCHAIFTISCIYKLFYCRLNLNPFLAANACTFKPIPSSTSGIWAVNQVIGDVNISHEDTPKIYILPCYSVD